MAFVIILLLVVQKILLDITFQQDNIYIYIYNQFGSNAESNASPQLNLNKVTDNGYIG